MRSIHYVFAVTLVSTMALFSLANGAEPPRIEAQPVQNSDPANLAPALPTRSEQIPATNWSPLLTTSESKSSAPVLKPSIRIRLLREIDLAYESNLSRGMQLEGDKIQIEAAVSGGQIQYNVRCEGPVSIKHGNTTIQGKSAQFVNGKLIVTEATIHMKSESMTMQSSQFQIDYAIARLSIGTPATSPTPSLATPTASY